jgi:hypothetical protein
MVVFTPPIQDTPAPITPYESLDWHIVTISSQMDELMVYFRTMASPATQTYDTAATPTVSTITPDTPTIWPVLEPT